MQNVKCVLCKDPDIVPWEMIPELNGHICCPCSYNLCSVENEFDHFKEKAVRLHEDLDYLKRITKLLVNRWGK